MAHSGPTLSYPVSQVRSGEQDLKGLVQSLRLAPWVDRSISMTPSLRMALSSFRSRRNVVLGHPGGEIGWEQGWALELSPSVEWCGCGLGPSPVRKESDRTKQLSLP